MTHQEAIDKYGKEFLMDFYAEIEEEWGSLDDHPYDEDDEGFPIPDELALSGYVGPSRMIDYLTGKP